MHHKTLKKSNNFHKRGTQILVNLRFLDEAPKEKENKRRDFDLI